MYIRTLITYKNPEEKNRPYNPYDSSKNKPVLTLARWAKMYSSRLSKTHTYARTNVYIYTRRLEIVFDKILACNRVRCRSIWIDKPIFIWFLANVFTYIHLSNGKTNDAKFSARSQRIYLRTRSHHTHTHTNRTHARTHRNFDSSTANAFINTDTDSTEISVLLYVRALPIT